jgi:hypothetical protein
MLGDPEEVNRLISFTPEDAVCIQNQDIDVALWSPRDLESYWGRMQEVISVRFSPLQNHDLK